MGPARLTPRPTATREERCLLRCRLESCRPCVMCRRRERRRCSGCGGPLPRTGIGGCAAVRAVHAVALREAVGAGTCVSAQACVLQGRRRVISSAWRSHEWQESVWRRLAWRVLAFVEARQPGKARLSSVAKHAARSAAASSRNPAHSHGRASPITHAVRRGIQPFRVLRSPICKCTAFTGQQAHPALHGCSDTRHVTRPGAAAHSASALPLEPP